MWIKTSDGQLINTAVASAVWAGEKVDIAKLSYHCDEYDVNIRLNTGSYELIEVLETYHTQQAAQDAVDAIGEALRENRAFFDMKEIPKESE